jgi:hypothetical protein
MEDVSMASAPVPTSWNVEQLLDGFEQLSPTEQREFQRRLAARGLANGVQAADEAALVRAAQARLPAADERRLGRLLGKSERGRLTSKELAAYQALAQEAHRIDAARAEALAELARRGGRSTQP